MPNDTPNDDPPRAGELCATCPNPDLVAVRKVHFGNKVWHFECSYAIEVHAQDSGILIRCSGLDGPCRVENNQDVFVGSPDINPLKEFLETTLGYLGLK